MPPTLPLQTGQKLCYQPRSPAANKATEEGPDRNQGRKKPAPNVLAFLPIPETGKPIFTFNAPRATNKMSQTKELFETYTSRKFDSKNKLNRAEKKPTADFVERLEAGTVEIEELDSLTLPVFVYQTQLTIHGDFKDVTNTRAGGYQSLTVNKNGSLGVRYSAIDAAKKETLAEAFSTLQSEYRLHADSTACSISRRFADRAGAIAEFKRLEIDKYLMKKQVYKVSGWGLVYYVIDISLFAIHAVDVWPLLAHLDSRITPEAVCSANAARKAEYDQQRAEYATELATKQAAAAAHFTSTLAPYLASRPLWDGKIPEAGVWLVRERNTENRLTVVFLRAKSKLWISRHSFATSNLVALPTSPPTTPAKNIRPAEAASYVGYRLM